MKQIKIKLCLVNYIFLIISIKPSIQNIIRVSNLKSESNSTLNSFAPKSSTSADNFVTYVKTSIPNNLMECIEEFTILKCMKIYLIQKLEKNSNTHRTGNLNEDLMNQINSKDNNNLFDRKLMRISDRELTRRLIMNFENFFENREIKLHFIPGVLVKVVASKENKLKFSLKKRRPYKDIITADDAEGRGRGHKNKKKYKKNKASHYPHMMLQIAIPTMLMPAVLLGSILPFTLPALKMAAIMSTVMNNGALLAALMYAAKSAVFSSENEAVHYTPPGYH